MRRNETVAAALVRGAVFHAAVTATALGALTLWAHACESRRQRRIEHACGRQA